MSDEPNTPTSQSGGINVSGGQTSAGGDIVGRDKITNIYAAAREQHPRTFTIPTPPRDFTGRETEIDSLVKALTTGGRAAISGLAGMGGVGKSALASVVAYRVVKNFPDAEMWIDLHGMDDAPTAPTDAMRQVILAFNPNEDLRRASDDQIAQIYRDVLHSKSALVVLDNAKDAAQIRPLLTAEGVFIVTSRHYFVEQGLQPVRLDVLNEADARALLLTLSARIDDKADTISELCGRLPLALQIAGRFLAMHDDLSPEWYAAQLKQTRLAMLKESDELDVEATFALTYDRLDSETQAYWRMLAVFPAPFGADAAAYVWQTEEQAARLALSEMRNVSIVEYDKDADKYRLHDLLREFARGR